MTRYEIRIDQKIPPSGDIEHSHGVTIFSMVFYAPEMGFGLFKEIVAFVEKAAENYEKPTGIYVK